MGWRQCHWARPRAAGDCDEQQLQQRAASVHGANVGRRQEVGKLIFSPC